MSYHTTGTSLENDLFNMMEIISMFADMSQAGHQFIYQREPHYKCICGSKSSQYVD